MYEALTTAIKTWFKEEENIPLHRPLIDQSDQSQVSKLLESGFVSNVGSEVTRFEQALVSVTQAKHVIATTSGTSALHLSLLAAGVGQGDLVITQALTFAATGHAILQSGASPVYIDIDPETLSLSPSLLEQWLNTNAEQTEQGAILKSTGQRLAACLPVHIFGMPAPILEIKRICQQWKLILIEDAAEALGSLTVEGNHCGTIGDMGILSFNGNKIITTGNGGAVLTNSDYLAQRVRHIGSTAKQPHPYEYIHDELGYNYRMSALNASLGLSQLTKLPNYLVSKQSLLSQYREILQHSDLQLIAPKNSQSWNCWLVSVRAPSVELANKLLRCCHDKGIQARPLWRPLHLLPHLKSPCPVDLPETERQCQLIVSLPSSARVMS